MPHLKTQLVDYWRYEPKVKVVRAQKREGLIRARLLGKLTTTFHLVKSNEINSRLIFQEHDMQKRQFSHISTRIANAPPDGWNHSWIELRGILPRLYVRLLT